MTVMGMLRLKAEWVAAAVVVDPVVDLVAVRVISRPRSQMYSMIYLAT
jgi:hypothetical protein